MIYLIEKHLWREGSETQVRSTIGEVALRLEKVSTTFSTSYVVYDRYHVELGQIKKVGFGKSYEITYDNKLIGRVELKKKWFRKRYVITSAKGQAFSIRGKIESWEYNIYQGMKKLAQVHHKLGSSSKTYGFETINEEYRYLLLCGALALHIIHH